MLNDLLEIALAIFAALAVMWLVYLAARIECDYTAEYIENLQMRVELSKRACGLYQRFAERYPNTAMSTNFVEEQKTLKGLEAKLAKATAKRK